jgi:hypothetical protein
LAKPRNYIEKHISRKDILSAQTSYGTVAKAALYLLDVDPGFVQLGSMGMPQAVEVELAVARLFFDDVCRMLRDTRPDESSVRACVYQVYRFTALLIV